MSGNSFHQWKGWKDQRGVTAVMVAVVMVVLIGFGALAVDMSHLYLVRNELQNASDAGALAGARVLYTEDGTAVNEGANGVAVQAATANQSDKAAVDVHWSGGNGGDAERGHWSFATRTFTPNDSLVPVDLANASTEELDANVNFINAVRVRTRRQDTPAASFLARIFGRDSFIVSAESVAYIGFAGTLTPEELDQPIAICKQSLLDNDGDFTCGVGRMINSGSNIGHNTGGWTNLAQPCSTANPPTVRPLVCGSGNPDPVFLGQGIGTVGGMQESVYDGLVDCWKTQAGLDPNGPLFPETPWKMTLPVVNCDGNNLGPCSEVVGSVELNVLWITRTGVKNSYTPYPKRMAGVGQFTDWVCPSGATPEQAWTSFIDHFQLRDVLNNSAVTVEDKTIYFLPDCDVHVPAGRTGGENFGILAKIPVLVK